MESSKQFDAKKRIEELETLIIKFVDNHKNVIKSEDPTGYIINTYYQMLRDSKEVLNNPEQCRENIS